MSYKKIKPNTFNELTMNVFMLVSTFNPATFDFNTGIAGSTILASTTGGVTFTDTPTYTDLGDDIDNCPKNTMELKRKDDGEVKLSGNLVTVNPQLVKMLVGAATIESNDIERQKITPTSDIGTSDFTGELWGITDYGDDGIMAIKMKRVLNTSGFSVATTDKNKAQFAFEFTCHKTIENEKDPAYEVYILNKLNPSVHFTIDNITVAAGDSIDIAEYIITEPPVSFSDPEVFSLTSQNSETASVTAGSTTITGVSAGTATVTAQLTYDGNSYSDTLSVVVVTE